MNALIRQTLIILSCGGAQIIWRYAWALFLSLAILHRPFPLLEPLGIFTAAYIITVKAGNKAWRRYKTLSLHIVGFTSLWLLTTYRLFYPHVPLFNSVWMADWFKHLSELPHFCIQFLFIAGLLSFWLGACSLAKREKNYLYVCLEFDKGVGALFLLLLVKFLAQQKGGLILEDSATRYLLFAYFAFSLIAVSLSRNQSAAKKTFRQGYHGMGIVLAFLSIVLITGAVLTSLFLPYLTIWADSAQSVLKETTEPMYPVLVKIIRFIFSSGRFRRDDGHSISGGSDNLPAPGAETGWALDLAWTITMFVGLIALGLCGYLIRMLVIWLLKKNTIKQPHPQTGGVINRLLAMMLALWQGVWGGLRHLVKKIDTATAVYTGMLRWGRRSGLRTALTETPIEYSSRLRHRFPKLKEEIDTITDTFNMEVYGNTLIDEGSLIRILSAQRKMRSPKYWRLRLKSWFAHNHNETE